MSLFSKLFGGGGSGPEAREPEVYKDFAITPDPIKEGARYRIAARIEKEVNGEMKVHQLIRADTLESLESAMTASLDKAKTVIDQQGERVFD